MNALIIFLLVTIMYANEVLSQGQRLISSYVKLQLTATLRDATMGNNPIGIGTGIHSFLNTSSAVQPFLDVTGDVYLPNDKLGVVGRDGEVMESVWAITTTTGGAILQTGKLNPGVAAGTSFVNKKVLLTLKPSLTIYLNSKRTWLMNFAYIHVFKRSAFNQRDFSSFSTGIARKIF